MATASPIKDLFNEESDLKPYLEWLSVNTRFKDAIKTPKTELPIIYILDSIEYKRTFEEPSLALYAVDSNAIYFDKDYFEGRPDIVIHELVHFFQRKSNEDQDKNKNEVEARLVQKKFKNQKY